MSIFSQDTVNPLLGNDYQNEFAIDKSDNYNMYQEYMDEYNRRQKIANDFNDIQIPKVDYLQQASNAIGSLRKPEQTSVTIDKVIPQENKSGKVKDFFNNNSQAISAGLSMAGAVGDSLLNNSYKGNQGAYVSGAFGKNQMYDDIYNTNTTIAATNFNDAQQQYKGMTNQLNAQKTKELSGGQIGGLVGTGAAKGAAIGTQILPGWGTAIGAVVGAGAGALKGISANNQISDSNLAISQKQKEANNYLQRSMSDIRQRNANIKKQSAYNMYAYNNAYGGKLNKKYKVGDIIDIDSKTMKQMLDEGYTFEKSYDVDDVIDIDDNELKKLKKLGYEYEIV